MKIPIRSIETNSDNYPRAGVDALRVAEYSERMYAGDKFPEIVIYDDGQRRHLSDGRHRILAAQMNGETEIEADVRHGTKADALWFGLGANRAHGSRMTSGDLRHAIWLGLRAFPDRSPQTIADRVGCSRSYVVKVRAEMEDQQGSDQVDTSVNLPGTEPEETSTDLTEPHGVAAVAANEDVPDRHAKDPKAEVGGQPPAVQVAPSGNLPATVVGKDGKHYPARRTRRTGQTVAKPKRPKGRGTLAQLKRYWKIANGRDREAFLEWVATGKRDSDHGLGVSGPPDDGPRRGRDEQDEAEG